MNDTAMNPSASINPSLVEDFIRTWFCPMCAHGQVEQTDIACRIEIQGARAACGEGELPDAWKIGPDNTALCLGFADVNERRVHVTEVQPMCEDRTPYRPASTAESMAFNERFCARCLHESEDNPCDILTNAMLRPLGHPEYPDAIWIYMEGDGICTKFEQDPNAPIPVDPKQLSFF